MTKMEKETREEHNRKVAKNRKEIARLSAILAKYSPYRREVDSMKKGQMPFGGEGLHAAAGNFLAIHGLDQNLKHYIPDAAVWGYSFHFQEPPRYRDSTPLPLFAYKTDVVSLLIQTQDILRFLKTPEIEQEAVEETLRVASQYTIAQINRDMSDFLEDRQMKEGFFSIHAELRQWQETFAKYKDFAERAKDIDSHPLLEKEFYQQLFQRWEDYLQKR